MQIWLRKWRPENGKISFKKNLDLFMWQKWKMPTPGERINMKEREDIMRMSLFPWGFQFTLESVTQLTHRVLSQKHWGTRKNVRKLLWHAGSKLLNFSNKRSLKKPWMQGLSITTPARSPECRTQQTMNVYGQSAFHETRSHFLKKVSNHNYFKGTVYLCPNP